MTDLHQTFFSHSLFVTHTMYNILNMCTIYSLKYIGLNVKFEARKAKYIAVFRLGVIPKKKKNLNPIKKVIIIKLDMGTSVEPNIKFRYVYH